ncbi:uncharacterized protein c8h22orf15 isoform 1-T1 [Synchiropus picturatus]
MPSLLCSRHFRSSHVCQRPVRRFVLSRQGAAQFQTSGVLFFSDDRVEMFNLDCKLMHFVRHVKERCGVEPSERVELMDRRGALMNLEERRNSPEVTSSLLAETQLYVLLRVCRDETTGGPKYESLLKSSQAHPELLELLRKLSHSRQRDRKSTSVRRRIRRPHATGNKPQSSEKNMK